LERALIMQSAERSLPYGIVGFDPGNTSAIGIVDFEGNVILMGSFRGESLEFFARKIGESCVPSIFASDVSPAQGATKKLAAAFRCKTWAPEIDLGVLEKRRIVFENFDGRTDVHERDALSAAFFCLFSYSGFFERARKKGATDWKRRAHDVLKGDAVNLSAEERSEILNLGRERKESLPFFLKERILKERIASLEKKVSAERERATRVEGELLRERKAGRRMREPAKIGRIVVENKALVRNAALESENARRVLESLSGKGKLILLESGKPVSGGLLYVRNSDSLTDSALFSWKVKIVFSETGNRKLACKNVRISGRSIFNGRFFIAREEETFLDREEERDWQKNYLEFVSR